jgi:hypothetical protein
MFPFFIRRAATTPIAIPYNRGRIMRSFADGIQTCPAEYNAARIAVAVKPVMSVEMTPARGASPDGL